MIQDTRKRQNKSWKCSNRLVIVKSHIDRSYILHIQYHSSPGETTNAEYNPCAACEVHVCCSAPLTHTSLTCSSTVKVNIFTSDSSPSFNCGITWLFKRSAWRNVTHVTISTLAELEGEMCKSLPSQCLNVPCQIQALICLQGVSWQPCLFAQWGRLPV